MPDIKPLSNLQSISTSQTHIITADCPSQTGTVDVVTRFLFEKGFYINEFTPLMIQMKSDFLSV